MLEFSLRLTKVQRYYSNINVVKLVFSATACCKVVLEVQNLEAIHFHSVPTIKYYRSYLQLMALHSFLILN